jgi:spore germination cell wall hydrolase CwlJ-like protein
MKKYILPFVAALCIAVFGSAAVAKHCDPKDPIDEVTTLALNMYFEARGDGKTYAEQVMAMQMVGEVTLNRVRSDNYPDSICEVVYQDGQFSWTSRRDKTPREIESWIVAVEIAESLMNGSANYFNNGATHFINPEALGYTPRWARRLEMVGRVGSHVFYTDNSVEIVRRFSQTTAI